MLAQLRRALGHLAPTKLRQGRIEMPRIFAVLGPVGVEGGLAVADAVDDLGHGTCLDDVFV